MKWNPSELLARLGKDAIAARFQILASWVKARPRVSLAIAGAASLLLIATGALLTLPRSDAPAPGTANDLTPPVVSEESPAAEQAQQDTTIEPSVAGTGAEPTLVDPNQHPSEAIGPTDGTAPALAGSPETAPVEPAQFQNPTPPGPQAAPAGTDTEMANTSPELPEPPPGAGQFIFEPANEANQPVSDQDAANPGEPDTAIASGTPAMPPEPLPEEIAGTRTPVPALPDADAPASQSIGFEEPLPRAVENSTPPTPAASPDNVMAQSSDPANAAASAEVPLNPTAPEDPLSAANDGDSPKEQPPLPEFSEKLPAEPSESQGGSGDSAVMPAEFAQAEPVAPAAPPGGSPTPADPAPQRDFPLDHSAPNVGQPEPNAEEPIPDGHALPEPGQAAPTPAHRDPIPQRPAPEPAAPTSSPDGAPATPETGPHAPLPPAGDAPARETPNGPTAPTRNNEISFLEDAPPAASPALSVQVHGPQEIQLGNPCTYRLVVRNNGTTVAEGVQLVARATGPFSDLEADPPADSQSPYLIWDLGALEPGSTKEVTLRLKPVDEGEISVAARVLVAANVASKTRVTQARLTLVKVGPTQVEVGERVKFLITVSNPGTGTAHNVVIRDAIPDAFSHPAGSELEYTVGDLGPGESREVPLEVTALKAGSHTNTAVATADGGLKAEASATVVVTAANLTVTKSGPERRYLGDEVVYTITVSNTGTAPARGVTVVDTLPQQLRLKTAPPAAKVAPDGRSLTWSIDVLPPGGRKTYQVTCAAVRPGEVHNRVVVTARGGLKAEAECVTTIIAVPALLLEVVDTDDPLEVGATTTYEVRIVNQGTKPISGLIMTVELPEGMEFVAADAPAGFKETTNGIVFDSIPSIAPRASVAFYIRVRGLTPGDKRIRVRVQTGPIGVPVIEEESTKVYDGG